MVEDLRQARMFVHLSDLREFCPQVVLGDKLRTTGVRDVVDVDIGKFLVVRGDEVVPAVSSLT